MVEIGKHGDTPNLTEIEINNPRPLVNLPSKGLASWETAKELLKKFPDDNSAYIRLNVEIDDYLPVEAQAEAASLVKGKQCHVCHINAKRKTSSQTEAKVLTVQEFQAEQPIEIAKQYAHYEGISFDEEMTDMFNEIVNLVNDDARNEK
jgi:exonuclease SbcD